MLPLFPFKLAAQAFFVGNVEVGVFVLIRAFTDDDGVVSVAERPDLAIEVVGADAVCKRLFFRLKDFDVMAL